MKFGDKMFLSTDVVPTINSSLIDWLDYIENLSHIKIDLGLNRIRRVALDLDLLDMKNTYVILVGGTNGKGTTCYLLESILLNSKITVGLYTSPHLLSYKERVRVFGKILSDNVHVEAFSVVENIRNNIPLTYFEFITLSTLYIFKKFKLDIIILEVGLGGRLDATNIIDPDISVITNIAIDHTDFLGDTLDNIAVEKSGIFRFNKPAIFGDIKRPVIVDEIVKSCKAMLFARGRDWNFYVYKNKWIWKSYSSRKCLYNLPMPLIPLENAATALSVLHCIPFKIHKIAISYGLRTVSVFGRFQIVHHKPCIILDVGHNPHAADYVIRKLSVLMNAMTGRVRVVIGMLKNKDIKGTVCILSQLVTVWYCVTLETPLAVSAVQLSNYLINTYNTYVKIFPNMISAFNQAILDSDYDDYILVFGSFFAISPIMKMLKKY